MATNQYKVTLTVTTTHETVIVAKDAKTACEKIRDCYENVHDGSMFNKGKEKLSKITVIKI